MSYPALLVIRISSRGRSLRMTPTFFLGRSIGRTIVVCQIEMSNPGVKGRINHLSLSLSWGITPEVMPASKRNGRKLNAPTTAFAVRHATVVTRWVRLVFAHPKKGNEEKAYSNSRTAEKPYDSVSTLSSSTSS